MKLFKEVLIILFSIVIVFLIIGRFIVYLAFEDMTRLPRGELINEVISPQGTYTVKTYLCNGGATVDFAVRGELIYNKRMKKSRNIYWEYKMEEGEITWWSNETAVIINHRKIDIPKGSYDWRNEVQANTYPDYFLMFD